MNRTYRRILFITLALAFIVFGTSTVLYADGWRFDFTTLRFSKVGAISIRYTPADAKLEIDGKPIKKRFAFFQSGIFVNGVFPGERRIRIERDGYQAWERTISVEPARVAEIQYATLVPTSMRAIVSSTPADTFELIGAEPLVRRTDGALTWRQIELLDSDIIGWTNDLNRLLVQSNSRYSWYDLIAPGSTDISSIVRRLAPHIASDQRLRVLPDPTDSSHLLVHTAATVALLDLEEVALKIITTSTPEIEHVAASRDHIAFTVHTTSTNTSHLALWEKTAQRMTIVSRSIEGRVSSIGWSVEDELALLTESGTLYLYNNNTGSIRSRADTVQHFAFAEHGRMLATAEQHSMEIFSLDTDDYWRFNLPNANDIVRITWHRDGRHVFIHYADHVAFLDLEDRRLETYTTVVETIHARYDARTNMLYFIEHDSGRIVTLQFPAGL